MKNFERPIFKMSDARTGECLGEFSYRDLYSDDGYLLNDLYRRKKAGEVLFHCHCNPTPIPMTISSKAGGGGYYIKSYPNRQQEHIDCMFNVSIFEKEEFEVLGTENNLPIYRVHLDIPDVWDQMNTKQQDTEIPTAEPTDLLSFISGALIQEEKQNEKEAPSASKEPLYEEERIETKSIKTPVESLLFTWFNDYWKRMVTDKKAPVVLNEQLYSGLMSEARRYVIKPSMNLRLDGLIGIGLNQEELEKRIQGICGRHKMPALILLPVYRVEKEEDKWAMTLLNIPTITGGTIKTVKVLLTEAMAAQYHALGNQRCIFVGGCIPASIGIEAVFGEFALCADNGLIVRSEREQSLLNKCHAEGRAAYIERRLLKDYGYYEINAVLVDVEPPCILLIFEPPADLEERAAQNKKLSFLKDRGSMNVWCWDVSTHRNLSIELPNSGCC